MAFIVPVTLEFNMWEEDVRIIGVGMKYCNTNRTGNGEGKPLCIHTLLYRFKVNIFLYLLILLIYYSYKNIYVKFYNYL